ncbi:hypothetical protein V2J09_019937 [Rumex salicifolius]
MLHNNQMETETETIRVRRVRFKFEDPTILTSSQRLNGLNRSWILMEPTLRTISDLVSHLIHTFHLSASCPNGLLLSMDGFVLPYFESTAILKDKDIVCVKRISSKTDTELPDGDAFINNSKVSGLNNNQEGARTPSCLPDGTQKVSVARSTSRKKARRRWLRAQHNAEKEQQHLQQVEDLNADLAFRGQNLDF